MIQGGKAVDGLPPVVLEDLKLLKEVPVEAVTPIGVGFLAAGEDRFARDAGGLSWDNIESDPC